MTIALLPIGLFLLRLSHTCVPLVHLSLALVMILPKLVAFGMKAEPWCLSIEDLPRELDDHITNVIQSMPESGKEIRWSWIARPDNY